jgi:hypothetical protein
MDDESRDILAMLAEGRIQVDEAEQLLEALETGRRRHEGGRGRGRAIKASLRSVKDSLAELGPMIQEAVEGASNGLSEAVGKIRTAPSEDLPPLEVADGRLEVEDGAHLLLRNDRVGGNGGGLLILAAGEGDACQVQGEEAENLRVYRAPAGPLLRWAGGTLRIAVPARVRRVEFSTLGSDLSAERLGCELDGRAVGGDVSLTHPGGAISLDTMGGSVACVLGESWRGKARIEATGGNIAMDFGELGGETKIEARTLGGEIALAPALAAEVDDRFPGSQRARFELGDGEPRSSVKLKTSGGNIKLGRA